MKTKRSVFLTLSLFLTAISTGTQLFSTKTLDPRLFPQEIIINVKKAEDKGDLIKTCEQNKHKFTKPSYFVENWYLIKIPGNEDVKIAVNKYKELPFVEVALLDDEFEHPIVELRFLMEWGKAH